MKGMVQTRTIQSANDDVWRLLADLASLHLIRFTDEEPARETAQIDPFDSEDEAADFASRMAKRTPSETR
jgi:hypothetical protein